MPISIQDAIDTIIAAVPGSPFTETVDTVKTGDASQPLSRVAVTFSATCEVLEQAVQLGVNLIITHEPTFYNHFDNTDWLSQNPIYATKRRLIEQNNLVIWRFHDYFHSIMPDNTVLGMMEQLGWKLPTDDVPYTCHIPPQPLRDLARWVQTRLGQTVRIAGNPEMLCEKIAIVPGFSSIEMQVEIFQSADVIIAGEIHEWEGSEYVRDAAHLGQQKGLIVTGHQASEEAGIQRIIPWLQERLPGAEIDYIPTGSAFHYL